MAGAVQSEWRGWALPALAIFALALALRIATFGDPNLYVDDAFYALVGQRMHEGALPYVDVWDRKPLGLFLIYAGIAGISASAWAYQIAAWLFAAATGVVAGRIVEALTGSRAGGLRAGLAYVLLLGPIDGYGAQSPVFYSLFVALAALLVVRQQPGQAASRRDFAAMLLCGLALTIKQTTLFEGAFLGCWILFRLHQSGARPARLIRDGALLALTGALPTLLIAAGYAASGHWDAWWNAMVTSNLAKASLPAEAIRSQAASILVRTAPIWVLAAIGLATAARNRAFVTGWIVFALLGFLSVPNFFVHYALPLMLPLSVAAGVVFARTDHGRIAFLVTMALCLFWWHPTNRDHARKSIASTDALAAAVRAHAGDRDLFVYDGPPALYDLTGKRFLSPLVFPDHLNHANELNVAGIDTNAEIARVLALRPGAVVLSPRPRNQPANAKGLAMVTRYARAQCRLVASETSYAMEQEFPIEVWGDCR
jgi:hypothetical protein